MMEAVELNDIISFKTNIVALCMAGWQLLIPNLLTNFYKCQLLNALFKTKFPPFLYEFQVVHFVCQIAIVCLFW